MKTRLLIRFQRREKYIIIVIVVLALLHFILVFVNPAIHNILEYPNRSLDSTLQTPANQYVGSMFWIWSGFPFLTNLHASSNVVLSAVLSLLSIASIPITLVILKKISRHRRIIYAYLIAIQISGLLLPDNANFFS